MIIMVIGLPGSGKSYFAVKLAQRIKADYISSDKVRNEILNNKTYSENEKLIVYHEMLMRMLKAMKANNNVVLDATFYKEKIRQQFTEAASDSTFIYIEVIAEEQTAKERLSKTRMDSDADFEVYKKIKLQWEPLKKPHLTLLSTNNNIEAMLNKAIDYLHINDDNSTST